MPYNIGATLYGTHENLTFTTAPASASALIGSVWTSGSLIVSYSGQYRCQIDTTGYNNVDFYLMPLSQSGTAITPHAVGLSIIDSGSAGIPIMSVSGSALAALSGSKVSLTNLNGVSRCAIQFTLATGSSVTFKVAEVAAK